MVEWHHGYKGCEFEQTLGDSEGQGSLECYSPWGLKEWGTTWGLNKNSNNELMDGVPVPAEGGIVGRATTPEPLDSSPCLSSRARR